MKYEFEVEEQSRLVFPAWKAVSFHSAAFPDQCICSSTGQRRYFRLIAIAMQKILHLMSSFYQIQAGMFLSPSVSWVRKEPGEKCGGCSSSWKTKGGLGFDCRMLCISHCLSLSSFSTIKTVLSCLLQHIITTQRPLPSPGSLVWRCPLIFSSLLPGLPSPPKAVSADSTHLLCNTGGVTYHRSCHSQFKQRFELCFSWWVNSFTSPVNNNGSQIWACWVSGPIILTCLNFSAFFNAA